jgi:hypothetical protein
MMITYHPHKKNIHNLKIVVFENFKNSKYHVNFFKFQKSFARYEWVIMCMTHERSLAHDIIN